MITSMINNPAREYASIQRVFALSERDGTLSPNRLPVAEVPIAEDVFAGALVEREAQIDVDDMLMGLGSTAVSPVGEISSHTNGFGSRSKTRRAGENGHPAAMEVGDSVGNRMKFIDALGDDVVAEIDDERRSFYTYEESVNPWDGDRYLHRKYIYDAPTIEDIKKMEKEALGYVLQALRAEALGALPRMRDFPGAARLKRDGDESYVNIATLLGRLDNPSAANEHNQRPRQWKDLIRSMVEDLKGRYELRGSVKTDHRYGYSSYPAWREYRDVGS